MIHIADKLQLLRKERGITQEGLAKHLGVSKPAVSKWESGQSYPDISMLPLLASYYDVTIDELMGYDPQMSKEAVQKLYTKFVVDFTKYPFDQVMDEVKDYLKRYYSCWELQFQLAVLTINHVSLLGDIEKARELVQEIYYIFERIEKLGNSVVLARQAVQMQGYCYLALGEPEKAVAILEHLREPTMPTEPLLVKAYQMQGNYHKALVNLQGYVCGSLMNILGSASDFLRMYIPNKEKFHQFVGLFEGMIRLFDMEQLQPLLLFELSLTTAGGYIAFGEVSKALDAVENAYRLLRKMEVESFQVRSNKVFDLIEEYLDELQLNSQINRGIETIKYDFIQILSNDPTYVALHEEARMKDILRRLTQDG